MRNPILSAGILIGVLCAAWTFFVGFTGWYKDPVLQRLFLVAIVLETGGLIWGLRRTAALGRTYGAQVVAGTMMAIVAGVIMIAASLLFTTVVFPDYFTELQSAHRSVLQQQGKTDAEIMETLRNYASEMTPMNHALQGFVGMLITGSLASAVIAIWVRSKRPTARAAV